MSRLEAIEEYQKALKLGQKEVRECQSRGKPVNPAVLHQVVGELAADSSTRVGLVEIPASRIVGTKTAGRISAFSPSFLPLLDKISEYPNIRVKGLMAIPPISQKNGDNVKFFQKMCNISVDIIAKKEDNDMAKYLSMGMSDDFADAIACGSTMIRVGTAIFGARDYTKLHQT